MTAGTLHTTLTGRGFRLWLDAGKLLIHPANRLTAADRDAIRQYKPALMELLSDPRGWEEETEGPRPGPPADPPAPAVQAVTPLPLTEDELSHLLGYPVRFIPSLAADHPPADPPARRKARA